MNTTEEIPRVPVRSEEPQQACTVPAQIFPERGVEKTGEGKRNGEELQGLSGITA
ncbi:MAG: hypothetical protein JXK93_02615 [Sphaerochaetaceae bacterium]|nr:hypothetical protein [Sphaerochaetaceae bacterium]